MDKIKFLMFNKPKKYKPFGISIGFRIEEKTWINLKNTSVN